jgi:hypothetical protein
MRDRSKHHVRSKQGRGAGGHRLSAESPSFFQRVWDPDEADVPRELTPSARRKAEIAKRVMILTKEIAAIRGSEEHPLFTHEELKWWRDNRPSFLILNLGLSSDEIIGHVTAKETTPKWAAVAIVAGLTHWTGPRGLQPNTVVDYSRRYRKLTRYL